MTQRPNILWYCSDQQRFDTIGALGNPHIHTPRLDEFMASGVAFTHAFCQAPICTPSRASFLSGMYASALGVNGNGYPAFPAHYADRLITNRLNAVRPWPALLWSVQPVRWRRSACRCVSPSPDCRFV